MVDTTKFSKSTKLNMSDEGLAFDDVLLIPQFSEILPSDVDLTKKLTNKIIEEYHDKGLIDKKILLSTNWSTSLSPKPSTSIPSLDIKCFILPLICALQ